MPLKKQSGPIQWRAAHTSAPAVPLTRFPCRGVICPVPCQSEIVNGTAPETQLPLFTNRCSRGAR